MGNLKPRWPGINVGDIVSRSGDDRQKVLSTNGGPEFEPDMIEVECIKASDDGVYQVGDRESNLARRYSIVGETIDVGSPHLGSFAFRKVETFVKLDGSDEWMHLLHSGQPDLHRDRVQQGGAVMKNQKTTVIVGLDGDDLIVDYQPSATEQKSNRHQRRLARRNNRRGRPNYTVVLRSPLLKGMTEVVNNAVMHALKMAGQI